MHKMFKAAAVAGMTALAAVGWASAPAEAQDEPVHVALADLPEMETLFFLVGLARAGEQGLDYELTFFASEDLAIQAILAGQAHIGLGSPYSVIQRASVPVRMFYQVSRIIFFPVVAADIESWQDLEGESIAFHQRGGPLEPLAAIMAEREGVTLGEPQYIPGSENRVIALRQGHIRAAILDLLNKNMIMEEEPDNFRVLPWVGSDEVITDEALFARQDWLEENQEQVDILTEEMLRAAQELCENPRLIAEERERFNLLEDLPEELANQVADYYEEAIEAGVYSCDGGDPQAAENDLEVLERAGQLDPEAGELTVENFWYFEPLERAKAEVGVEDDQSGDGAAATQEDSDDSGGSNQ